MKLLRLVIVDDEPILLEGLIKTYDWARMGFEVVGSARSGEQAIEVIREKHPHVVLTDIRMKKMSGLMVMEEMEKEDVDCLFIVLSAYRDFEYAKQACDLGAFAYLLKPIEDEKLTETMQNAYKHCMEQLRAEEKYENWEKLLLNNSDSFLQAVIQKYVQGRLSYEKISKVFETLHTEPQNDMKFITVCADIDLAYKITNSLEYETAHFSMIQELEEYICQSFFYWKIEHDAGMAVFLIKTKENCSVRQLKEIFNTIKKKEYPIVAAISKPYKGIQGMKKSYDEARILFEQRHMSGSGIFSMPEEPEEKNRTNNSEESELMVVNAVRRNNPPELKEAFVQFIYSLPKEEETQRQYLHKVMLKTEFMLRNSYGMTEALKEQFQNYYSNIQKLTAAKTVDVCYKILCSAIEKRTEDSENRESGYCKEYLSEAIAYIKEHLNDEQLSIVSVAGHVYLNPVYFGRAFKNTFHTTFKKYLMTCRMEKAKRLLEEGKSSIGNICDEVGISNPSYFSHLFKEYTGKLPSEYKKEYEG